MRLEADSQPKTLKSFSFMYRVLSGELRDDDKLVRSLFRDFMKEIEGLDPNEIMVNDIRLEHLNITQAGKLELFKTSCPLKYELECKCNSTLRKSIFKAPEMKKDPFVYIDLVNIYAAGILLFTMKFHRYPFDQESTDYTQVKLKELFLSQDHEFWEMFCRLHKINNDTDSSFKELVFKMTKQDPRERAGFVDIIGNSWYLGDIYPKKEILLRLNTISKKYIIKSSDLKSV